MKRSENAIPRQHLPKYYAGKPKNDKNDLNTGFLFNSVQKGHVLRIPEQIEAGADVNGINDIGATPLMMAVLARQPAALRTLIRCGAEVDKRNARCGLTALAIACRRGDEESVGILLENGADVNHQVPPEDAGQFPAPNGEPLPQEMGSSPLMQAAVGGNLDIVRTLLAHQADPGEVDWTGRCALMYAIILGKNPAAVPLLIDCCDVNRPDCQGKTALMHAVQRGDPEVVEALLAAGAKVDAQDLSGKSALMYALESHHCALAHRLIAASADLSLVDDHGRTAVHYAMLAKSEDTLQRLLEAGAKAQQSRRSDLDEVGLAVSTGSVTMLDCLLAHGADINFRDSEGRTPLMRLIRSDDPVSFEKLRVSWAKVFVQRGADLAAVDGEGRTAEDQAWLKNRGDTRVYLTHVRERWAKQEQSTYKKDVQRFDGKWWLNPSDKI